MLKLLKSLLFGKTIDWENLPMEPLTTPDALDAALETSTRSPILILKHSTRCPISARAFEATEEASNAVKDYVEKIYIILVVEDRPVSNHFAEVLGLKHESPQAALVRDRAVVWHGSHGGITVTALKEAVELHAK